VKSAQAAGRGVKRRRSSADLAAPGESVVHEFLQRDVANLWTAVLSAFCDSGVEQTPRETATVALWGNNRFVLALAARRGGESHCRERRVQPEDQRDAPTGMRKTKRSPSPIPPDCGPGRLNRTLGVPALNDGVVVISTAVTLSSVSR
jgi:hypothetical protein